MKRRLFWKILLGFWLTIVAITQIIWLMFSLLQAEPAGEILKSITQIAIDDARATIQLKGEAALRAKIATWPSFMRGQLIIQRDAAYAQAGATDSLIDPQGVHYQITSRGGSYFRPSGPFDIPRTVLLASILGGLCFSLTLAWYLTKPIRHMQTGFHQLARGDLATRLGPAMGRRRDELADLARDFDTMAGRLEELVKAKDRLLASVSHELRSPLARLQLAIEIARQNPNKIDASLQRIEREAILLGELVGEVLILSRLEGGTQPSEEYFDLAELVSSVVDDAAFEAEPLGVAIKAEIATLENGLEWVCVGSGKLVSRAIENIVRNAIRFSSRGQQVTVKLINPLRNRFELTVIDQGSGVTPETLQSLFQPFVQGNCSDGKGFGLGLAIAERTVLAHGGSIGAHRNVPSGLVVSVSLPASTNEGILSLSENV